MSTDNISQNKIILPNQCKAARNLLGWKQKDLADISGVGLATIGNFENKNRIPQKRTLKDIRLAFEKSGLEIEDNEEYCMIKFNKK